MTLAFRLWPPPSVGLAVGLLVNIFQAVTQIQEQSLTLIPKIVGVPWWSCCSDPGSAGVLHHKSLHRDPLDGELAANCSPTITAGFILVLARVTPLFILAPCSPRR